jgi:hypothetical protein
VEGAEAPYVDIPVRLRVVGNLKYPSSVYFSKRTGEFNTREIRFQSRTGKPAKIVKIEDPEKRLKITKKGKADDGSILYELAVLDAEKEYSSPARGELKVKTTDKDEPEISIRYTISTAHRQGVRASNRHLPDALRRGRKGDLLKKQPLIKKIKDTKKE